MEVTKNEIRQILIKSTDPAVQEVANTPKLLGIIEEQYKRAGTFYHSQLGQAVVFGAKQLGTTIKMARKATSPSALAALAAQKFLLTGKLIAKSDLVKCGVAVGFLASESVLAVAAGVPTGGTATIIAATPIVLTAYDTYDACKEVSFSH